MKKSLNCPYSMIDQEIICEHKMARVTPEDINTVHNHDGYEVVLFLKGDVNIMIEPELFKMKRGDMFFISPLVFHGIDLEDITGYERIVINVQYEYLKNLGDAETDFSTLFRNCDSANMNHLRIPEESISKFISIAGKLEEALHSKSYGHSVLSKAYLAEFLLLTCKYSENVPPQKKRSSMPVVVSKILDYIDTHLSEDITINAMSAELHYSSDHLSRAFSEATGDSLKHYINAKKIALAQKLLLQNNSPYDVCFMVGYNNYSSFSRRFSKQIGMSPKQFQLSYRAS
ncbi:AraC family transcriptional regulator [Butyrivibrio sp. CB08]|uniref:AraC family transcriptional regulator n=1 Tax=Butyrivibrio sp. CB08 TaxID=2364879 RepID=UPI000EA9E34C|nr:AraC family transcriptional regulator [Butyrivibrio sp. CB08]RKM59942.1 AraC family transcriptional regulator [Butyrivibrio sp. CB08]